MPRGPSPSMWPEKRLLNDLLTVYIIFIFNIYRRLEVCGVTVAMTSIRLDTRLADEAARLLGVKSRTEAVHVALREIVALKRFKKLMSKNAGKLSFAGQGE